jgi:hypothetical protein
MSEEKKKVSTESVPFIRRNSSDVSKEKLPIATMSFDDKVNKYVKEHSPKLSILTPCYGSMCYVNYVNCLISTLTLFRKFQFNIDVIFCKNDSLVSRARNNLIAKAMADPRTSHILFIDNDIAWNPYDILKLVISNKPIIGGAYPLKNYHWDKVANHENITKLIAKKNDNKMLNSMISDTEMIQYNMVSYNVNHLGDTMQIEGNISKVKHIATGFMMIQRTAIEKMMKAFPSTKYTDDVNFLEPHENNFAYALFDCGVEDGHYYSEDWMFCERWNKMGGQVYLDVSINLLHTGMEDFRGSYVATIL